MTQFVLVGINCATANVIIICQKRYASARKCLRFAISAWQMVTGRQIARIETEAHSWGTEAPGFNCGTIEIPPRPTDAFCRTARTLRRKPDTAALDARKLPLLIFFFFFLFSWGVLRVFSITDFRMIELGLVDSVGILMRLPGGISYLFGRKTISA